MHVCLCVFEVGSALFLACVSWAHTLHTWSCPVSSCSFDSSLVCSARAEEEVVVAVSFNYSFLHAHAQQADIDVRSLSLSCCTAPPPTPRRRLDCHTHPSPLSPLSNALADRSKMKRTPIVWRHEQQRGWCLCHFCLRQQARRSSFKCCVVWLATWRRRREGSAGEL